MFGDREANEMRNKASSVLSPRQPLPVDAKMKKGIGYALLYIGDQIRRIADGQEKKGPRDLETKG